MAISGTPTINYPIHHPKNMEELDRLLAGKTIKGILLISQKTVTEDLIQLLRECISVLKEKPDIIINIVNLASVPDRTWSLSPSGWISTLSTDELKLELSAITELLARLAKLPLSSLTFLETDIFIEVRRFCKIMIDFPLFTKSKVEELTIWDAFGTYAEMMKCFSALATNPSIRTIRLRDAGGTSNIMYPETLEYARNCMENIEKKIGVIANRLKKSTHLQCIDFSGNYLLREILISDSKRGPEVYFKKRITQIPIIQALFYMPEIKEVGLFDQPLSDEEFEVLLELIVCQPNLQRFKVWLGENEEKIDERKKKISEVMSGYVPPSILERHPPKEPTGMMRQHSIIFINNEAVSISDAASSSPESRERREIWKKQHLLFSVKPTSPECDNTSSSTPSP